MDALKPKESEDKEQPEFGFFNPETLRDVCDEPAVQKAAYNYCFAYSMAKLVHADVPEAIISPCILLLATDPLSQCITSLTDMVDKIQLVQPKFQGFNPAATINMVQTFFKGVMNVFVTWQSFIEGHEAVHNGIVNDQFGPFWGTTYFCPRYDKLDKQREALDQKMKQQIQKLSIIDGTDFSNDWIQILKFNDRMIPWWFTDNMKAAKKDSQKPAFNFLLN